MILQILIVSIELFSLFFLLYFKHLINICVLIVGMTFDFLTGRKNMSITALKFLTESNKGEAPIKTIVVRSSRVSKRKIASISRVTIVGIPLKETWSSSILIGVPSLQTKSGASS